MMTAYLSDKELHACRKHFEFNQAVTDKKVAELSEHSYYLAGLRISEACKTLSNTVKRRFFNVEK